MTKALSEQEKFWGASFGDEYVERNQGERLLAANLKFFGSSLRQVHSFNSCLEFGANIGMNLEALRLLYPKSTFAAVEINEKAAAMLKHKMPNVDVTRAPILDYKSDQRFDLVLCKTVLIHINPQELDQTYETLYRHSAKFILLAEYHNPNPVSLDYRGEKGKLFKRDFAGEMLARFSDLSLRDYGFAYRGENELFDDINWFLLEKERRTE